MDDDEFLSNPYAAFIEGQAVVDADGGTWAFSAGIWSDGERAVNTQQLIDEQGPVSALAARDK